MQTFGSFLVAFLSASLVAGTPVPSPEPVGSFELHQTRNANFKPNGAAALAKAYAKFGKQIPPHIAAAAARGQAKQKRVSGSAVANSIQGDLEYTVPVKIGTPAQTLQLDFDTGSSDLWVFSSETPSTSSKGHSIYNPSKSSTSKKVSGATWSITYGDRSSSSGDVYTDTVSVGPLTVAKQTVESAQKVSAQFVNGGNDGLLGLAFSTLNTVKPTKAKTWFDSIKSTLDSDLFVADLRHNAAGSYTFGAIPSGAKNIGYTSVDKSQGFWGFSTTTDFGDASGSIADTGTTLLLLPDEVINNYYGNVQSAQYDNNEGGVVFDCSETLPDFHFTVGGKTITIPGSFINYGTTSGSSCFGGLQSSSGIGINIFGDIALKAAYVIFDDANNRLGWAQKV